MKGSTWAAAVIGLSLAVFVAGISGVTLCLAEEISDTNDTVSKAFNLRMDGHTDAARNLLEKSIESGTGGGEEMYELARLQFYLYDFEGAKKSAVSALMKESDNARYYSFAALAFSYNAVTLSKKPETRSKVQDEIAGAVRMQEKAVDLDPANTDYRLRLVELYRSAGNETNAKAQAQILAESDPVYGAVAQLRLQGSKKSRKRLDVLRTLLPEYDTNALLHETLFHEYLRAGNTESGLEHLHRAVKLDPSRVVLFLRLGRHNIRKPDIGLAEKGITLFLEFKPEQPAPLRAFAVNSLAIVKRMQGEKNTSEKLRSEARKIDSHCWTTFMPPPRELFQKP